MLNQNDMYDMSYPPPDMDDQRRNQLRDRDRGPLIRCGEEPSSDSYRSWGRDRIRSPQPSSSSRSNGGGGRGWEGERSRSGSPRRRRSRSRTYSRESSRSRSRSRSPSPYHRRSRRRSRSRSRSWGRRSRSRSPYDRFYRPQRADAPPNHTIVVKGLPLNCEEDTIWNLMESKGFRPRDVRILKRKDTGQSRGFGFVEFVDVEEATRWMHYTQGLLKIDDRYTAELQFSVNKPAIGGPGGLQSNPGAFGPGQQGGDWICSKCSTNNFKKRDQCFKCGIRKEESDALVNEGLTEIGVVPCDTLVLRQLPRDCSEEKILSALKKLTSLDIQRVTVTPPPRTFAYVQMKSASEAAQLLTTITALTKLLIDGKEILPSYSKLPLTTILTGANLTQTAADWQGQVARVPGFNSPGGGSLPPPHNPQHRPSFPHFPPPQQQQPQQPQHHQQQELSAESLPPASLDDMNPQTDSANRAAAVAQHAIKKAQVMRHVTQQVLTEQVQAARLAAATLLVPGAALLLQQRQQILAAQALQEAAAAQLQQAASATRSLGTVHTQYGELPRYPPPDVSQYQYEEQSGYYFDSTTGLYYDATSRYYYNADSQQWLYWDGQLQTYLPHPQGKNPSSSSTTPPTTTTTTAAPGEETKALSISLIPQDTGAKGSEGAEEKGKKEKEKLEKVKIAKKIQKDMEKWAKQMDSKKKGKQPVIINQPPETQPVHVPEAPWDRKEKRSATADTAFSMLEKSKGGAGALVSYEPDSDEETPKGFTVPGPSLSSAEEMKTSEGDEDTDWSRLACLLCRRQFPTRDVLIKHQQFSSLHKQNLEAKSKDGGGEETEDPQEMVYRDRAKERRQKYGAGVEDPQPSRLKQKYLDSLSSSYEQPTVAGIGSDNIGNKLLKSMGWKEGTGLGRKGQGIVDPIKQERRIAGAGLGASGSVVRGGASSGSASYKDNVKAALRERFQELE